MRALVIGMLALVSSTAFANPTAPPCSGKAVRAAMRMYLLRGVIQGDEPMPSYRLKSVSGGYAKYIVTIEGGNDEGESWSINYWVVTDIVHACKVVILREMGK